MKLTTLATLFAFSMTSLTATAQIATPQHLSDAHTMVRVNASQRFLLLPVEEKEENAHVDIVCNNQVVKGFNLRLAVDKVDYLVPLDLSKFDKNLLLDITFHGDRH